MAVALVIGIRSRHHLGRFAATRWPTTAPQVFAILGVSFPSFFLATILILIFAINLNWLPVISNGIGPQLLMPAITLGAAAAAILARLTRSSMLDVLSRDYIRTARAKGLIESKVIWIHALRNALIPVITVVGLEFGSLLGGAVAIEAVFFRQGLGMRLVEAIEARDYPVIQALVLLAAVVYAVVNLFVDILYTYVDPRVRLTDQTAR